MPLGSPGWRRKIELMAEEVGSRRREGPILVRTTKNSQLLFPWSQGITSSASISSVTVRRREVVSHETSPMTKQQSIFLAECEVGHP